ncbi:MAG: zinc ribbon domain-containing protein [SAR324 cluster bacterium]|nr:zinc ribbon domain-containing protein [SAR324 cluster bacterium]
MPIYEYVCKSCNHELEEVQKFNDPLLTECPECHQAELSRKMSVSSFHLKGGGWYKDGYHGSDKKPSTETSSESKPSDKKETSKPKDTSQSTSTSKESKASTSSSTSTSNAA